METLPLCFNVFLGLLLSQICFRPSCSFPQQHAPPLTPAPLPEESQRVNTVSVVCHPDSLEVIIKADMFGVGAPVNNEDIRLGVEHDGYCRAAVTSAEEYRILVGLMDCGTRHWMTEEALIYTNLLIYSPEASPDGLIRMDEAVIPVECHYERKYSLSSSSLTPTWIPYTSTQAAVETLQFDFKIMTNDWQYERSSNVFYLGDPIGVEASVRVGHHMGLRVFVSSCVATLQPDIYSVPRYVFIENGCLVDSQLPGSKSHFLPRVQNDKLHLVIDAFRFHNEDRGELYITCHLNAVPVVDTEAPNKACTLTSGRWKSADGNDYLCGQCQNQNEVGQTWSSPAKFGPRGFDKPESFWSVGQTPSKGWEHEAKVGPMLVLPGRQKSGPLPEEEVPPVLFKISRPALYGSHWRSGLKDAQLVAEKGLSPEESTDDDYNTSDSEQTKDLKDGDEDVALPEKLDPDLSLKSAEMSANSTAAPVTPTALMTTSMMTQFNTSATQPELSTTIDPKR